MYSPQKSNTCKNCDLHISLESNFCPNCGQEQGMAINWAYIGGMLVSAFSFDNGFLFNVKRLIMFGGAASKDYINGKSKSYQNPILFFFSTVGLLFLFGNLTSSLISGEFPYQFKTGERSYITVQNNVPQEWRIRFNYLFATFIIIPFLSFITHLTEGGERKFANALISSFLYIGVIAFIHAIILLLNRLFFVLIVHRTGYYDVTTITSTVSSSVLIIYTFFYFHRFFSDLPYSIIRGLIVTILISGLVSTLAYLGNS